ncbi:hypothetical protein XHV734_2594 [Xanthomonas hortorum pv. vitians]|nr:hypothetical protein XHV734_2594 [Xanthomonas hortorum pv. vitians]
MPNPRRIFAGCALDHAEQMRGGLRRAGLAAGRQQPAEAVEPARQIRRGGRSG